MKIVKSNPPNYDKIAKKFDLTESVVFTYGDKLYVPNGEEIPLHLMVHEEVHEEQQGDDPEAWWDRYLEDPDFRLQQEVEAYRKQYKVVRKITTKKQATDFLNRVAKDLSGKIYGNVVDYKTARQLIRK